MLACMKPPKLWAKFLVAACSFAVGGQELQGRERQAGRQAGREGGREGVVGRRDCRRSMDMGKTKRGQGRMRWTGGWGGKSRDLPSNIQIVAGDGIQRWIAHGFSWGGGRTIINYPLKQIAP